MLSTIARVVLALVLSVAVGGCGGGSSNPSTPTSHTPTTTTPPPTPTPPPVVSPPAVQPTPFTGRWSGRYIIERCDGTGSVQDLLCGNTRGLFPPGTSLPIALDLTQNGSTVSGTIALGQIIGVVTGAVRTTGLLTLSGVARSGTATATLTYWDTQAVGNTMNGFFNFSATYTNIPGNAEVAARLSGVAK